MIPMREVPMAGYKRTNFEEEDQTSIAGTPPGVVYDASVAFKTTTSPWQKYSFRERVLLLVLFLLSMIVVVLAVLVASHKEPIALCTSKSCITVASEILNSMNEQVDPCDDFYEYACGGWVKDHPIPSGESHWSTFGVMIQANQLIMKNVLEKPINASHSEAEKKAKMYYASCIDKNKTIQALGSKPLIKLINQLGGWQLTPSGYNQTNWNFQQLLGKLHRMGLALFINVWVGEDEKHNDRNILQFDQAEQLLAREQYLNKTIDEDKVLGAYHKLMVDITTLLGGDVNETREEMTKVLLFEQRLANISIPAEEKRDEMLNYHRKNISELQKMAPFINWMDYLNTLLNVTSYKVDSSEQVVLFAPKYLKSLSTIIVEMMETEEGRNTLNNYMLWHLIKPMSSYLSKEFQNAKKEFAEVISGATGYEEPWRICAQDTDNIVGFALGSMFVQGAFEGDSKKKAEEMITEVKTAFKNNLPNLAWMDDETRRAAIDKANAVVDMIGFPEFILNKTKLEERYAGLDIKIDEYFENNIRDMYFNTRRNLDKLRKKPDKTSWSMSPATVNAYYTPTKNEIVFPAGILQAPFYHGLYPKSLNFGAIGVVMGHELTHGFDDQGREYDKSGILRNWWNNASIARFKDRTKCMVDQYSKYDVNGENIRGKQTLGENIADNGGLKSAYHAYVDWVRRNGAERPLPGVDLTHRQLFFLAFAQVWCSSSMPEAAHMSLLSDSHSPAKYRVIGTLSNSKEFAEEFQCPKDTKMNPSKKCEVW